MTEKHTTLALYAPELEGRHPIDAGRRMGSAPADAMGKVSDLEIIRAMLARAKIPGVSERKWETGDSNSSAQGDYEIQAGDLEIKVEGGYPGFYSTLMFNKNGELVAIEAFE